MSTAAAPPAAGRCAPCRSADRWAPTSPESMLDVALDYEELAARNGLLGHGGVVVFDDTVNMAEMARYAMEFCAQESCGKCTPCRIGSTRGVEVIDRIIARQDQSGNLALLRDLCDTMTNASLCALGGLTPLPVLSALKYFPRDFGLGDDAVSGLHYGYDESTKRSNAVLSISDKDYGTPAQISAPMVELEIDGKPVSVPAGTSVMRAAAMLGSERAQAVRHRLAGRLRLVPPVRGRDRGTQGLSRLLHDTGGTGHEGAHADPARGRPAPQRDGALHLRPSAGLPDLSRQRPLRVAGHGRSRRVCATSATATTARIIWIPTRTSPILISPSTPPSASYARAACARAKRSRAPSP